MLTTCKQRLDWASVMNGGTLRFATNLRIARCFILNRSTFATDVFYAQLLLSLYLNQLNNRVNF